MTNAESRPSLDVGGQDETGEGYKFNFRLPKKLYREMQAAADEENLLVSEYLRKAVRMTIDFTSCDECGEDGVPGDASYCPYCGVEFEDEEEPESEEEEDRAD